MLTRLRVRGFKSLEDAEIRFGPLTCIVGPNNAGKSNVFDAITFLGLLAQGSLVDAARKIRNGGLASLFTKTVSQQAHIIQLEADLLINADVVDDFGRAGAAAATYLRYGVTLQYVPGGVGAEESIALVSENLSSLPKSGLAKSLGFAASKSFLSSVYRGARPRAFIVTDLDSAQISMPRDGVGGLPVKFPIRLARGTVLSQLNTIDFPTALAVKRELQSWITLGMELTALRRFDEFYAPAKISSSGAHLPSAFERISDKERISSQLSALVPDVDEVVVHVDAEHRRKTLYLRSRSGLLHDAKTLSDGVLRFLGLAVIGADSSSGALLTVEEPENGIHPAGAVDILRLLQSIAVAPDYPVNSDNPLRQVIVNTHSPVLVQNLRPDELIVCHTYKRDGALLSAYSPLQNTWRDHDGRWSDAQGRALGAGAVLAYLNGTADTTDSATGQSNVLQEYRRQLAMLTAK